LEHSGQKRRQKAPHCLLGCSLFPCTDRAGNQEPRKGEVLQGRVLARGEAGQRRPWLFEDEEIWLRKHKRTCPLFGPCCSSRWRTAPVTTTHRPPPPIMDCRSVETVGHLSPTLLLCFLSVCVFIFTVVVRTHHLYNHGFSCQFITLLPSLPTFIHLQSYCRMYYRVTHDLLITSSSYPYSNSSTQMSSTQSI
jgi:hypothetical protein